MKPDSFAQQINRNHRKSLPSGGVLDISLSKSPCRKAIGSSFQFQPSLSATIWRQIFTILAVMKKSLLASFASSMLHHFSLLSCSSEPKLFRNDFRTELHASKLSTKDQIILATGRGHFGRFLGFSDFSLGSTPMKQKSKSCLNDIKFWEVSGIPKTSRFWKSQLSTSSGTQKSAKIPPTCGQDDLVLLLLTFGWVKFF